jgi:Polyketide cyclase / dehydrase and lipid transport
MAKYRFVTNWHVTAPIESVWNEIYHSEFWPTWWKGVESVVELTRGDRDGIGGIRRYTWKSRLPYKLTFDMRTVRVEPLSTIEAVATGELEGKGLWQFSVDRTGTVARYDWEVQTTKLWMNMLSPLARPLFKWNHDVVMGWGAEGLRKRLGAV